MWRGAIQKGKATMRPLTDEEYDNFKAHVRCNYRDCYTGMGLAGRGVCGGEWDNPDCPKFKSEEDFLKR